MPVERLKEMLLDLIYPPRCPICGEISKGVCLRCIRKNPVITQPRCCRCGQPLEDADEEFCKDCEKNEHVFVKGRAAFVYQGAVKESIHRMKYENKREYLQSYAAVMGEAFKRDIADWNPDVCIPIPMFWKKQKERGFNQAELLAKLLGGIWNIPVDTEVLQKIRDTSEQKKMSVTKRAGNVRNAFAAKPTSYETVVLVDDVYTTGNTIDAAAAELIKAGVKNVYFVTICIGYGNV